MRTTKNLFPCRASFREWPECAKTMQEIRTSLEITGKFAPFSLLDLSTIRSYEGVNGLFRLDWIGWGLVYSFHVWN